MLVFVGLCKKFLTLVLVFENFYLGLVFETFFWLLGPKTCLFIGKFCFICLGCKLNGELNWLNWFWGCELNWFWGCAYCRGCKLDWFWVNLFFYELGWFWCYANCFCNELCNFAKFRNFSKTKFKASSNEIGFLLRIIVWRLIVNL